MNRLIWIPLLIVATVAIGATTFTTNYQFNKPGDGDSNYGELIRDNWDKVDTQLKVTADSITDHLADTTDAHDASAISAVPGAFLCTTVDDVQEYLDCLDGTFDPATSGVVLIAGAQTITGTKTFDVTPRFPNSAPGILETDGAGIISNRTFSEIDPLTTKGDLTVYDTATTRLAVGSDGQVLEADSGEAPGLKWGDKNPRWRKFTYSYSDFSTAATSSAVTAFSLQAGEGIDAVVVKHTTAFSGGTISAYTIEVGQSGDTNEYAQAFNVFQAVGGTVAMHSSFLDVPDFGTTTDVVVTARSTGDNLDQAAAGDVNVYVRTFVLP